VCSIQVVISHAPNKERLCSSPLAVEVAVPGRESMLLERDSERERSIESIERVEAIIPVQDQCEAALTASDLLVARTPWAAEYDAD
jgi:hypothetical protein